MKKTLFIFGIIFIVVFGLDQWIKDFIIQGYRWNSEALSIVLVYNKGVAFSMFSFLSMYLKYIQIIIIVIFFILLVKQKVFFKQNNFAFGMIFGAGCSNVLDRFIHNGVVDYVYWHYGFEFAIFNFADVMIDIGVVLIILKLYLEKRKEKIK